MNSNISNKVKKSDFVVNKYSLRLGKKELRKLQLYFNGDILLYTVNMNNHKNNNENIERWRFQWCAYFVTG